MTLIRYKPTELPQAKILEILIRYKTEYPEICGKLDAEDRAKKLFKYADVIVTTDDAGDFSGFLFYYGTNAKDGIGFVTSIARLKNAERGVARCMHDLYLDEIRRVGCFASRLEVAKDNLRALRFYCKLGYVKCEEKATTIIMKKGIGVNGARY